MLSVENKQMLVNAYEDYLKGVQNVSEKYDIPVEFVELSRPPSDAKDKNKKKNKASSSSGDGLQTTAAAGATVTKGNSPASAGKESSGHASACPGSSEGGSKQKQKKRQKNKTQNFTTGRDQIQVENNSWSRAIRWKSWCYR